MTSALILETVPHKQIVAVIGTHKHGATCITLHQEETHCGEDRQLLFYLYDLVSCNKYLFIQSGGVLELRVMSDAPMIFLQIIYASFERCF